MSDDLHDDSVEAKLPEQATLDDFEREPEDGELLPMHPANTPGGNKAPTLIAQERRKKALALRLNGASYAEIAASVGYKSAETCGAAIRDELKKLAREPASELRAMQYERLNTMLLVLQPGVMAGDPRFVQTALSVMDRMNALMGIAGEHEMEQKAGDNYLVVIDGAEHEYVEALKKMAGATGEEAPNTDLSIDPDALHSDAVDAKVVEVTESAVTDDSGSTSSGTEAEGSEDPA